MSKQDKIDKSKKRKKYLIMGSTLSAMLVAGGLGIATLSVADSTPAKIWDILTDDQKQQIEAMKEEKMAEKEEMMAAIEEGDYTKWKEIIDSRPKITDYVNEDNFDRFSEMHKLMQDGDHEGAAEIREELGMPDGMGMKGMGKGHGRMHGKGFGPKF